MSYSTLALSTDTCFLTYRAEIDLASVEVRFEDLSIDADIAVGARGEPTVLNAYRNKFEVSSLSLIHKYLVQQPNSAIASAVCKP